MSQTNVAFAERPQATATLHWHNLCQHQDLVANSGVVAWVNDCQVALFYLPGNEQPLYAVGNRDPKSGANVIGRGLLGKLGDDLVIASPLYKQHFRLQDGSCLEYPEQRLDVWPVRINGSQVEIGLPG
ncbi:nitrite reductase small subunit NirD [Pseudomonas sp. 21LCFQ010]|uniref:nitrite reductase small subunit NirD n=1 Tax=Pseudomonas sp. 21LCFQ010 TaxID=2957506 RepID=UPI0020976236|nr:nitrite reductase small subunit NirD [Pseudomonas sp. 21LCFQ010]MCO8161267.1 nitrite reductase small subunit NirD [Pseudomonas sp. 21LCFQ010]